MRGAGNGHGAYGFVCTIATTDRDLMKHADLREPLQRTHAAGSETVHESTAACG